MPDNATPPDDADAPPALAPRPVTMDKRERAVLWRERLRLALG